MRQPIVAGCGSSGLWATVWFYTNWFKRLNRQSRFRWGMAQHGPTICILAMLWVSALTSSGTALAVEPETIKRAWSPSIELLGDGKYPEAIYRMQDMIQLQQAFHNGLYLSDSTNQFINLLWQSVEAFDLSRFYRSLPESDNGWHTVRVIGEQQGQRYVVDTFPGLGTAPQSDTAKLNKGPQNFPRVDRLGDLEFTLQVKALNRAFLQGNYLVYANTKLGVGATDWQSVRDSAGISVELFSSKDPIFSASVFQTDEKNRIRARIKQSLPHLDELEIDIIAPLWASLPNMWDLFDQIGSINEVNIAPIDDSNSQAKEVLEPWADTTIPKQVNVSLAIDAEKMRKRYPAIAEHLFELGKIMRMETELRSEDGILMRLSLDTKTLTANIQVFSLETQKPRPGSIKQYQFVTDFYFDIYGIVAEVKGLRTQASYYEKDNGALIYTQTNSIPKVKVSGNMWGFMPTSFLNIFIPGDIESIVKDFVYTACRGNGGAGMTSRVLFQNGTDAKISTVDMDVSIETLDNIFLRLGMRVINDRLIPDAPVSSEIDTIIDHAYQAFSSDLQGLVEVAQLTSR